MTLIIAIDPGNIESGVSLIDADDCRPIEHFKGPNDEVLAYLRESSTLGATHTVFAIEMIESFGMAVAHSVFEACWWGGRFQQAIADYYEPHPTHLITRKTVKLNLCGTTAAKDPNIHAALVDRFAPNVRNRGKGTKGKPGWFYGFAADMWAAYAVAVTCADQLAGTARGARK